ncbi:MAG TPA: ammonium transporter [bacterium]|nr:ammonium transporter [bacterium]
MADTVKALGDQATSLKVAADTIWTLITAMLVFWMNAGFALVESGMCRTKNTVNILSKNFIVFAVSSISFWVLGWGLMFGNGNGFIGTSGLWLVGGADNSPATGAAYQGDYSSINWTSTPLWAKFFFQLVFAGTAATIVSGAVAERIKYFSFIVFSFILVGIIYPITGHWIWGGGWLGGKLFHDFAGSTVVHSVGGWAALAGALILGPRIGKYNKDGSANTLPAHNMSTATLGCLILWLGWFGFNPGSTMAADPTAMARICVTTNTAAAMGALAATFMTALLMGKPSLGMTINGCLAGLVAITAPCAFVSVGSSAIIGLIAGVLVVLAVIFFDKIKIDDPVGAVSVHMVNGVWGTLSVGLFGAKDLVLAGSPGYGLFLGGGSGLLMVQLEGIVAVAVFVFAISCVSWFLIKMVMGLRVSADEETEGLDIGEHGELAYPEMMLKKG